MAIAVRQLKRTDVASVMDLWQDTVRNHTHLALDLTFLDYFMKYPGVLADGILVAENRGKICGLEIISIDTQMNVKVGRIILLMARDKRAGALLLEEAERYCWSRQVDMILSSPAPNLATVFKEKKWVKFEPSVLVARAARLAPLVNAIVLSNDDLRKVLREKPIQFSLDEEVISARLEKNHLIVQGSIDRCARGAVDDFALVMIGKRIFLNLIFGNAHLLTEVAKRRFSVRTLRDVPAVLRILGNMKVTQPVLATLADMV